MLLASIGVAIVLILAVLFLQRSGERGFREKWPAISDEEFLKRCPDGVSPEVALRVRRIISEQLNIPYAEIHPDQRFVEDLKTG